LRVRAGPYTLPGMRQLDARLEIRLPKANRRELDALAEETGLTSADLVRIGIRWLLVHHELVLRLPRSAGEARK
jgi:hypothetical protein